MCSHFLNKHSILLPCTTACAQLFLMLLLLSNHSNLSQMFLQLLALPSAHGHPTLSILTTAICNALLKLSPCPPKLLTKWSLGTLALQPPKPSPLHLIQMLLFYCMLFPFSSKFFLLLPWHKGDTSSLSHFPYGR